MKNLLKKQIRVTSMTLFVLALFTATAFAQEQPRLLGLPDIGTFVLDGAWIITLAADPASATAPVAPPQITSGTFGRDGTMLIHNTVPDKNAPCPCHTVDGVGQWLRIGPRTFALTWIDLIVSTADGTYVGMFQDTATVTYNDDFTKLSGDFSFGTFLGDSTASIFSGKGKLTATRVKVVMP